MKVERMDTLIFKPVVFKITINSMDELKTLHEELGPKTGNVTYQLYSAVHDVLVQLGWNRC